MCVCVRGVQSLKKKKYFYINFLFTTPLTLLKKVVIIEVKRKVFLVQKTRNNIKGTFIW